MGDVRFEAVPRGSDRGYTQDEMIDSRGIGEGGFKLPRAGRTTASASTGEAPSSLPAGALEQRQDHQQRLVTGRQLGAGWSSVLESENSPPRQEPERSSNLKENSTPQARLSGSENGQVNRVQVQVFSKPENANRFQDKPGENQSRSESEAQTRTQAPPGKSTTGGGEPTVVIKNVSTSAASSKADAPAQETPPAETGAEPKESSGPPGPARNTPRSPEGTAARLRSEGQARTQESTQAQQREATAQRTTSGSAVMVPTTLGNPHRAIQVYQSLMGQGIVTGHKTREEKDGAQPSRDRLPEKEAGDSRSRSAGASGASGGPRTGKAENSRNLQAALSGSVGRRDEDKGSGRPGLSAGWSGKVGGEGGPQSGRVVVAQVPIHSPILDLESRRLAPTQARALQGQQLAEFALAHAGHSIESLLKKAYQLDSRKELSRKDAIHFMALILKLGGEFTFDHCSRVLDLAMDLGDEVGIDEKTRGEVELGVFYKDLGEMALVLDEAPPEKLEQMGKWMASQDLLQAGFLHDLGKTQIPPEILYKPGKLTEEEYELMKLHPILGEKMIYPIESLRHLCPTVRHHHERWDGKGYPDGIEGEAIPLGARIIAIVDVFDALTEERPYKPAMSVEKVRAILQEGKGTHFDPDLAEAFGRVLQRRYPELGNPFDPS